MSYGTNAPFGLQPRNYLSGSPYSGKTSAYAIPSGYTTALYSGDPVYVTAAGYIAKATLNAAGNNPGQPNPIMGVFWGVKYTDANGIPQRQPYWVANTVTQATQEVEVEVIDDPNVIYDVQAISLAGNIYFQRNILNANAN